MDADVLVENAKTTKGGDRGLVFTVTLFYRVFVLLVFILQSGARSVGRESGTARIRFLSLLFSILIVFTHAMTATMAADLVDPGMFLRGCREPLMQYRECLMKNLKDWSGR